jgi:hypothetical protein
LQGQHRRRHVGQEHKVAPFLAGSDVMQNSHRQCRQVQAQGIAGTLWGELTRA